MSGTPISRRADEVRTEAHQHLRDDRKRKLVEDLADLLQTVDYCAAGDYAPDEWEDQLRRFARKWGDEVGVGYQPDPRELVNSRDIQVEEVTEDGIRVSFGAETTVPWDELALQEGDE